ncbi:MAG: hypothetical protein A2W61_06755 [Deltaproteobacteria bacterium RIFCSPLOWO2_01_44_7]|nr:MAG: hypothetical protein A2712_10585 [Deltaproteobacteria bacterium RIFCSPHIGHO2_01_FULL_43_49]OGQ15553.1 MAG: hypothetical protein A3D22_11115 [Deltaproteobacteria bacterium RIFCSPHIGHO2_02_FULL_44_53]OGQ28495.1 MAG: hypothetical protein A3D98_03300 [Deltaproteobacteria bacterium RIFCSPHIGHO2_12_FULL_44_21]OGQ32359.1 MAG: hypothetical protein A2979_00960 [Deltaproteobacteria bacterium RIFCSPLOWO2_01_FULL_45_74]OGQ40329.1 MAG: hypothetical protein A2W61_06755 [Deltaproteobacteria bacterium 
MKMSADLEANFAKAKDSVFQVAKKGAQVVCLSELFGSLYFCQKEDKKYFELAESIPGPSTKVLSQWAKELKIVIIASLYEKSEKKFYNTAVVLNTDGGLLGKYRKTHIPDDLEHYYGEKFYFSPGDLGTPVFKTPFGTIGVMVCWDQWYPEGARMLAQAGAQVIFYPTAIGFQVKGPEAINKAEQEAWQIIQRSHAIANNVFVAAVNRVGVEDHLNFWGTSFVADPLGRILKQASIDKEENLVVDCDLNLIEEVRKDWPFLSCRRSDLYGKS